jgi:hypothetical protein
MICLAHSSSIHGAWWKLLKKISQGGASYKINAYVSSFKGDVFFCFMETKFDMNYTKRRSSEKEHLFDVAVKMLQPFSCYF